MLYKVGLFPIEDEPVMREYIAREGHPVEISYVIVNFMGYEMYTVSSWIPPMNGMSYRYGVDEFSNLFWEGFNALKKVRP